MTAPPTPARRWPRAPAPSSCGSRGSAGRARRCGAASTPRWPAAPSAWSRSTATASTIPTRSPGCSRPPPSIRPRSSSAAGWATGRRESRCARLPRHPARAAHATARGRLLHRLARPAMRCGHSVRLSRLPAGAFSPRRAAARRIRLETEMLLRAAALGLPLVETPITAVSPEPAEPFRPVRDGIAVTSSWPRGIWRWVREPRRAPSGSSGLFSPERRKARHREVYGRPRRRSATTRPAARWRSAPSRWRARPNRRARWRIARTRADLRLAGLATAATPVCWPWRSSRACWPPWAATGSPRRAASLSPRRAGPHARGVRPVRRAARS